MHITDHKCMHFLHRFGAMPAGRLAELTGLTTGAVTGIIDRLEEAGYVRRTSDPKDRRRTIVEPTRNKKLERKLETIFIPLHERMHKLLSSYSDSELAFLLDAVTKSAELTHEESKKLRSLEK
ncbi:MAG: MarR family transcriptional regulator [Thaumarchaeota archaeon]|nr:MarR family transcriptional regulator [Nitrososphaerota archaeon]